MRRNRGFNIRHAAALVRPEMLDRLPDPPKHDYLLWPQRQREVDDELDNAAASGGDVDEADIPF